MKKTVLLLLFLCFLLSGCNVVKNTNEIIQPLRLQSYDDTTLTLQRDIKSTHFTSQVVCKNYREKPVCTYTLKKHDEIIEDENKVLYDVDVKLKHKNDVLEIKENVYYFDRNDSENSFAYNQITKVKLFDKEVAKQNDYEEVSVHLGKEMKWEFLDVWKAIFMSIKTGVFSLETIRAAYRFLIVIPIFILLYIQWNLSYVYSILRERTAWVKTLDVINIILLWLILTLFFMINFQYDTSIYFRDTSSFQTINLILKTIVFILLMIRCLWMKKQYKNWKKHPPIDYKGHHWILNTHRKYRFFKK